jgi:hypothetical protein
MEIPWEENYFIDIIVSHASYIGKETQVTTIIGQLILWKPFFLVLPGV